MDEVWIDSASSPYYQVSNRGHYRSKARRNIMSPFVENSGYYGLKIWNRETKKHEHVSLHREVANAFIPNPDNKKEVNHIDGNKLNNDVSNLEWCTRSENTRHAIESGLFTPYKLPPHANEGVKVRIIETGDEFDSLTDCANYVGGHKTAISACLRGKVKTHMGYHYERII